MATNEEIRLDAVERRMNKYDEILDELREVVIALKAKADANSHWVTVLVGVGSALCGGAIGHFIH
jgi:hypothetical protein